MNEYTDDYKDDAFEKKIVEIKNREEISFEKS